MLPFCYELKEADWNWFW